MLDGEECLRAAEAAHRAGRRTDGVNGLRGDVVHGRCVGSGTADARQLGDVRAVVLLPTADERHPALDGLQFPRGLLDRERLRDLRAVAFQPSLELAEPVVLEPHRRALRKRGSDGEEHGEERRVAATEAAARIARVDADAGRMNARALERRADRRRVAIRRLRAEDEVERERAIDGAHVGHARFRLHEHRVDGLRGGLGAEKPPIGMTGDRLLDLLPIERPVAIGLRLVGVGVDGRLGDDLREDLLPVLRIADEVVGIAEDADVRGLRHGAVVDVGRIELHEVRGGAPGLEVLEDEDGHGLAEVVRHAVGLDHNGAGQVSERRLDVRRVELLLRHDSLRAEVGRELVERQAGHRPVGMNGAQHVRVACRGRPSRDVLRIVVAGVDLLAGDLRNAVDPIPRLARSSAPPRRRRWLDGITHHRPLGRRRPLEDHHRRRADRHRLHERAPRELIQCHARSCPTNLDGVCLGGAGGRGIPTQSRVADASLHVSDVRSSRTSRHRGSSRGDGKRPEPFESPGFQSRTKPSRSLVRD